MRTATESTAATPDLAEASTLLACLSDPATVRVLGWVIGQEPAKRGQLTACASELDLDPRGVAKAFARLTGAGLIKSAGPTIELKLELLRESAGALDALNPVCQRLADFPHLRGLFSHGRLTKVPVEDDLLQSVVEFLASLFEPGQHYPEATVNEVLSHVYPDYALLRRMMVELGVMTRDAASSYTVV